MKLWGWMAHYGISALVRGGRNTRTLSSVSCTEENPYEDTARRQPSANWEERPHQSLTVLALPPRLPASRAWEIGVCCLSHTVCGILTSKPRLTKTGDWDGKVRGDRIFRENLERRWHGSRCMRGKLRMRQRSNCSRCDGWTDAGSWVPGDPNPVACLFCVCPYGPQSDWVP